MHRRFILMGILASVTVAQGPAAAAPARRQAPRALLPAPRRLQLRHAATGARFSGPYFDGRAHDPVALAELSQVLADTRTGAVRPFDPRALDILWDVAQRAGATGEAVILSGYRTPETNAALHGAGDSEHLRAGALDVHVPPERMERFGDTALQLARGGVGIYARRGFVHLDSGPVRRWGDVPDGAAPARPARPDPLARMAEAWAATRQR
jgi:uncharacterized protein YcbK (DUF882 family)